MLTAPKAPPTGLYALADHLDGALAAGEDLLAVRLAATADLPAGQSPADGLAGAVRELRRQEAALLLHLLQARRRASEIDAVDTEMRSVLRLIAAQTTGLLELVATYDPDREATLATLADVQQFLRERGVVAEDAAGLSAFQALEIGPAYRIGGMVELDALLDMAASALDLLDRRYDLYADGDDLVIDSEADTAVSSDEQQAAEVADEEEAEVEIVGAASANAEPAVATTDPAKLTPATLAAALEEVNRRT